MFLEKRGIPTVYFCPETFRCIVKTQAQLSGMPSYEPVTVPGHIAALSPQEFIAKIDLAADNLVEGLVSSPDG